MKKIMKPVLTMMVFLVVLAGIMLLTKLVRKYTPTSEKMDLFEYYSLEKEDEAAVILDGEILTYKGSVKDGNCYVQYRVAKDYLNDCFFWDHEENCLIYTTPTEIITIAAGESSLKQSGKTISFDSAIAEIEEDEMYLSLDFVKRYTGISYEVFHDPDRIVITRQEGKVTLASVRKNSFVRYRGGIKSPILREVEKNEVVVVLEDLDDWMCIVTQDGIRGYLPTKQLLSFRTEERNSDYEAPEYTTVARDYTINLVWHQITDVESNYSLISDIAEVKGVNAISPTWFSILSDDGTLESRVLGEYVATAHEKGMEVWALVDNFSAEIDFARVMNTASSRTKIENQLISAAIENGIDGINIDFESIDEDAAEGFIQFMRELSVKCRKNSLVLSVDVPPPTYTAYYNRKALGTVCDYVIMMGYDEHYSGSETAGSVASLSYEEEGLTEILMEVPAEKLISGIPFYTRLWCTQTNENGNVSVTSEALGMRAASNVLKQYGVETQWDVRTSQNYASFEGEDGALYEIWMEDMDSLAEKLELIKRYDLAGVAAWKLGLEDDAVWNLILKYVS